MFRMRSVQRILPSVQRTAHELIPQPLAIMDPDMQSAQQPKRVGVLHSNGEECLPGAGTRTAGTTSTLRGAHGPPFEGAYQRTAPTIDPNNSSDYDSPLDSLCNSDAGECPAAERSISMANAEPTNVRKRPLRSAVRRVDHSTSETTSSLSSEWLDTRSRPEARVREPPQARCVSMPHKSQPLSSATAWLLFVGAAAGMAAAASRVVAAATAARRR